MSKIKKEAVALKESLNNAVLPGEVLTELEYAMRKADEIVEESEKQGGERDPRTQLVVDILWQVNYHRKNLAEYAAQLKYLVK